MYIFENCCSAFRPGFAVFSSSSKVVLPKITEKFRNVPIT